MDSWHSYPSIFALGHRYIADLLTVPVQCEEKIDGSQFSFGKDENGDLHIRSKGVVMHIDAPERMFSRAAEIVKELAPILNVGWTYRAEYLAKPKHNTLAYDRIPRKHLILFDVNDGQESYLSYEQKAAEAQRIGLEVVPLIFEGNLTDIAIFREFLQRDSILGGQKIEGVVIKQQTPILFGQDKKALMGKFVSESFKEVHGGKWRKNNPTSGDIISEIGLSLKTPARWAKAVQHLRESGCIQDSPRDIGLLMKEIPADIRKECEQEIKERLFAYAWPKIQRVAIAGVSEWYKEELLKRQFEVPA